MNLKHHFIVSSVLSLLLFPIFKFNVIYIMIGGFLIDSDHYLYYIFKYRSFNLRKAYHSEKDFKATSGRIYIFHLIDVLILCVILSFYSKIFLLFTIGLIPHHIMDYYMLKYIEKNLKHRIFFLFQRK